MARTSRSATRGRREFLPLRPHGRGGPLRRSPGTTRVALRSEPAPAPGIDLIGSGHFSLGDAISCGRSSRADGTTSICCCDYDSYIECQDTVDAALPSATPGPASRSSPFAHGRFSSDRAIREYCRDICTGNPSRILPLPRGHRRRDPESWPDLLPHGFCRSTNTSSPQNGGASHSSCDPQRRRRENRQRPRRSQALPSYSADAARLHGVDKSTS